MRVILLRLPSRETNPIPIAGCLLHDTRIRDMYTLQDRPRYDQRGENHRLKNIRASAQYA